MTYRTYETLLLDNKDQITTLTFNRPHKKNAMNSDDDVRIGGRVDRGRAR